MEHKQKGVLIIGLGIIVLFGGILLITRCFEGKGSQRSLGDTLQQSQSSVTNVPVVEKNLEMTSLIITDPVENWKQCRNEKVGYEVKYPNGWKTYARGPMGKLPEECGTTKPDFVISPEDRYNAEKANFAIDYRDTSIGLGYVYSGSRSLEEYLQKLPYGSGKIFKETLIQGKRAVWIKDNDYTSVLTYNNNTVFIIMEKNISPNSFDDFLSTFKFLP